jgi:hypothetical protein
MEKVVQLESEAWVLSSVPLRRTLGCESWRSSAAAATRSRSESSPITAPLPFFS